MTNYRFLILLITAQLLVACSGESDSTSAAVEAAESAETVASSEASADAPKQAEKATSGAKTKAKKEPGAGPMPPKFAEIQEILKAASLTSEPGNMVYNAHSEPTVGLQHADGPVTLLSQHRTGNTPPCAHPIRHCVS